MLVDVLHRELHRGHDATADVTLRHVIAVREEAGDVDVALLAAKIDRLLTDALADQQQPAAARGQQHQRTTSHPAVDRPGHFPSSLLHPISPDDISRCRHDARFHLVLTRVTGYRPDEKPRATLVAARPSTSVRMTEGSKRLRKVGTRRTGRRDSTARIRDRFLLRRPFPLSRQRASHSASIDSTHVNNP